MKITKHQNTSVLPILQPGQGFTWTPEGLKSEELATWGDVPEDIKQLAKDINDREYEEHRRNNDVRFTGEKALEPEDWKFAAALAGGVGTAQAASTIGWIPAITTDVASGIGGTATGYGSNWVGQKIDNKFGTNVTPWLTVAGSLLGGVGGGTAGYISHRIMTNIPRIKRMTSTYTGVKHIPTNENPHITMDENFSKYNGEIWTSDNIGYARGWINEDQGKIFQVLTDPKQIRTIKAPSAANGEYFPWRDLPYRFKNSQFEMLPETYTTQSGLFKTEAEALTYKGARGATRAQQNALEGKQLLARRGTNNNSGDIVIVPKREYDTDSAVRDAHRAGYDAVELKDVYDGPVYTEDGRIVDIPINEIIYKKHTPHWVLPEGKSKWSLLFKNLDDIVIKKQGGQLPKLQPGGSIPEITPAIVTQDSEFNKFLLTLPDNLRLTPEKDYYLYKSWKMNGKPRNFQEGLEANMYSWDDSDNSYHGVTVIGYDENGVGVFGKPKHHDTVHYELDWYNKGIGTLEGGEQYPLQGEERKEWENFRNNYQLDSAGVDYRYLPKNKQGGTLPYYLKHFNYGAK